jgi:MFS family permease
VLQAFVGNPDFQRVLGEFGMPDPELRIFPVHRPGLAIPGAAVFAAFTIIALFSSLVPSFLRDILHEGNHAVAGAIAFLLFAVGAAAQVGPPRRLSSPACVITGLIALLATLALMQAGLAYSNLAAFVLGAVVGGFAVGLTFMGSLALISQQAPPDRRAEVVSLSSSPPTPASRYRPSA